MVELKKLLIKDGRIGVQLNSRIFTSDDRIVANIAHEVYEAGKLREVLEANGGSLPAPAVYSLVNWQIGTIHCEAWEYADELVRRRHGSEDS